MAHPIGIIARVTAIANTAITVSMTAVMPGITAGKLGDIMLTDMVTVTIANSIMYVIILITVSITLRGTIAMTDIASIVTDITRHPR